MNKIKLLYLVLFVSFALYGCSGSSMDTSNKIVPPKNRIAPLEGVWKITEDLGKGISPKKTGDQSQWVGKTAEFGADFIVFGDSSWDKVNYKVKRVDAGEYFLYKYEYPVKTLGIDEKELIVTTAFSEDKFLYEFARISDDVIIASIDKDLLRLEKVSDKPGVQAAGKSAVPEMNNSAASLSNNSRLLRSGLLLGVRSPVKKQKQDSAGASYDYGEYSYRTLWLASVNRQIRPVLEADDLFMPRKSGFWKIEATRGNIGGVDEDLLSAYSVSENGREALRYSYADSGKSGQRSGVLQKKILYAGNDYVSVEIRGKGSSKADGPWQENRLATIPVDNIRNEKGINISDIIGESGGMSLRNAISEAASLNNIKNVRETEQWREEQSFGLFRKTGHWFIKGRVTYGDNPEVSYSDLSLNLIPPPELVAYDTLHISWTNIKDRVPQAIDAFTSPSDDVAVIVTAGQALVYTITGGVLSETPQVRITLREGDAVVMAEWATGNYTEKWEKEFLKYNATRTPAVSND